VWQEDFSPDSSRYDGLQEAEKEDETFASKVTKDEYNTKRSSAHKATVPMRGSKRASSDNIIFFYKAAHRSCRLMPVENEGKMQCDDELSDLNTNPAQKEVISGVGY
jgi:hypothetical protein